jgi:hypothetical protein
MARIKRAMTNKTRVVIPAKREAREPESIVPQDGSRVSGAPLRAAPRPG